MKFYKKNSKGFTLIDILLTSAIVSLLSSLFLFQVGEARKKADDAAMQVGTQQVSNAIEIYKNDKNGKVPHALNVSSPGPYNENTPQYTQHLQPLVDGGFMPQIPRSPNGTSYSYEFSDNLETAYFVAHTHRGGGICRIIGESNTQNINRCNQLLNPEPSLEELYPGIQTISGPDELFALNSGEEKIFKFDSSSASVIFAGLPQDPDPMCTMYEGMTPEQIAQYPGAQDCLPRYNFKLIFDNGYLTQEGVSSSPECVFSTLAEGDSWPCFSSVNNHYGKYEIKNLDADLRIMSIKWTATLY